MYRKKKESLPKVSLFYLLAFLRFVTVSTLAFLLLSPILKYLKNKEEKPCIAFVQDNSASLRTAFRSVDSVNYRKQVQALLENLGEDYEIQTFSIGSRLNDSLHFGYTDQSTDISTSLETIMTTLESKNLSGVILASDGIYNQGVSPLSLNLPYQGTIFTIGLGDTTIQKDASVARVFANKIVYLGDKFAIRSDLAAYALKGNRLQVSVFSHNANRIITNQSFDINDNRFSRSLETIIDANSAGVQHYSIRVASFDGEKNIANNSQDVYVEVMDSKEKVLIVAHAPHPDIFALRDALSKNKNYQVSVQMAERAPTNLNEYNLVILHNLPSAKFPITSLLDQLDRLGISSWFITGGETSIPLFNQRQTCLQIGARGPGFADAHPLLNSNFSYFTLDSKSTLQQMPPLSTPFGEFKAGPNSQVLMNQRIGNVATNYPLWILQQTSRTRIGVTAGEGLWRWRLYDFNQTKKHDLIDGFINKTAQFLSVKRDQKQFKTQLSKTVYTESETITLDAELYNENYELINTPDVTLKLKGPDDKISSYTFNKNDNSYSFPFGNLSAGNYAYTASTVWNGKSFSATGNFTVIAQNIEEVNTRADWGLLSQLAKNYDGEFVYANQVASLSDKIRKHKNIKSIIRTNTETEPLIDWKWLFGLLLLCLSAEWFLRKRNGLY
jgi:hypothetical protein